MDSSQQLSAAVLAVVLTLLHFGIGPFSYVRYYALAPAFMAFTGYWAALILVWNWLKGHGGMAKTILLVGFLGTTTMVLHQQEALFIAVMSVSPFHRGL